jgi:hypothetical protein
MAADSKDSGSITDPDDLRDMRVRRDSPLPGTRDAFLELKNQLRSHILSQLEPGVDVTQRAQIRPYIHERLDALLEERGIVLNRGERRQLLEAIVADLVGL